MLYQNDSYTFTMSLTRETTTVLEILSVSYNASINPYAVYTFNLVSGPYPTLGNEVVIVGSTHPGNDGSFTIVALSQEVDSLGIDVGGTFSVTNTSAVTSPSSTGKGTIGTAPNVTTPPVIQIVRLSDFTTMLISPASMIALDSSNQLWTYTWAIGLATSGEYAAIVSYAADGNIFSGKFIEKVKVGDTYIIGTVALDSTVAKDTTVAKDATVAHQVDLAAINPDTSVTVLAIKSKTDNLPADPTGMTLLSTYLTDIVDIHDVSLGNQSVDKTLSPPLYTMNRVGGGILAQYQLTDSVSTTSRTKQ